MFKLYSLVKTNFTFLLLKTFLLCCISSNLFGMKPKAKKKTHHKPKVEKIVKKRKRSDEKLHKTKKEKLAHEAFYCSDEKIKKYLKSYGLDISKLWTDQIEENFFTNDSVEALFKIESNSSLNDTQKLFLKNSQTIAEQITTFFNNASKIDLTDSAQLKKDLARINTHLSNIFGKEIHQIIDPHDQALVVKAINIHEIDQPISPEYLKILHFECVSGIKASDKASLLKALGQAIAYHFSAHSLEQRLTTKENTILSEPISIVNITVLDKLQEHENANILNYNENKFYEDETDQEIKKLVKEALDPSSKSTVLGTATGMCVLFLSLFTLQAAAWMGSTALSMSVHDACTTPNEDGNALCCDVVTPSNVLCCEYNTLTAEPEKCLSLNPFDGTDPHACCTTTDQGDIFCSTDACLNPTAIKNNCIEQTTLEQEVGNVSQQLQRHLKDALAQENSKTSIPCTNEITKLGINQKIRALFHYFQRKPAVECSLTNKYSIKCCKGKRCVEIDLLEEAQPLSSCCTVQDNKVTCNQILCSLPETIKNECSTLSSSEPQTSHMYQELASLVKDDQIIELAPKQAPIVQNFIRSTIKKLNIRHEQNIILCRNHNPEIKLEKNAVVLNVNTLQGKSDAAIQTIITQQLVSKMPYTTHSNIQNCQHFTDGSMHCNIQNGGMYGINRQTEEDVTGALITQNPCQYARQLTTVPENTLLIEEDSLKEWGSWLKHKLWYNPVYSPWKKPELLIPTPSENTNGLALNTKQSPIETRQAILRGLDPKLRAAHNFLNNNQDSK